LTARLPLMVVAAMRPDRGAPSYALLDEVTRRLGERHLRLDLTPLDAASSRDLLVQLLGGGELPAPLERVLERSDGNPFYLEEVLRSLIDSGHLVKREGRWSVTGDLSDVEIPETLFGVLSARIDRLPEETRRVAQTAAVIGRSFERRVLGSVLTHDAAPWRVGDVAPHLANGTYGGARRGRRAGARRRRRAAPGEAHVRGARARARARGGVRLQARADAGGRLRQAADAAPRGAAPARGAGPRAPLRGPTRRGGRRPGEPLRAGRGVDALRRARQPRCRRGAAGQRRRQGLRARGEGGRRTGARGDGRPRRGVEARDGDGADRPHRHRARAQAPRGPREAPGHDRALRARRRAGA